jgi:hypothetical protein
MKNYIRAQSAPWRNAVELYIATEDKKTRVKEVILERIEDTGMAYEPSFQMNMDAAQALMDDLWQAGLRPTEGTGSAGALRAVERHLEDMRTLVFKSNAPISRTTETGNTAG